MADSKLSALTAATPAGPDLVYLVQGGNPRRGTAQGIAALATKNTVGLGNADNTSDDDKPVSTATQAALDGKVDIGDARLSDFRPPLYTATTAYTASGAISPSDRVAIINAAGAVTMTLASGSSNGQSLLIKRFGGGAVTITANLDGASSSIVADSTTIRESVSLAWSSSLSTWLIL
jgi:hypothetical protein